jgi:hypothetical protein
LRKTRKLKVTQKLRKAISNLDTWSFTTPTEFDDVIQRYIALENGSLAEVKSVSRKTAKGVTSIAEL